MGFLNSGAQHLILCLRDDPKFMDPVLPGRDPNLRAILGSVPRTKIRSRMGVGSAVASAERADYRSSWRNRNSTRHVLNVFEGEKRQSTRIFSLTCPPHGSSCAAGLGVRSRPAGSKAVQDLYPDLEQIGGRFPDQ
jgi:hypothetical protein